MDRYLVKVTLRWWVVTHAVIPYSSLTYLIQVEPLLQKESDNSEKRDVRMPFVYVENFNDKEETTCITSSMLLKNSFFKKWILVPLFSIFSILVFPLYLYWKPRLRRDWLYSPAQSVRTATHIYIEGQGKYFLWLNAFRWKQRNRRD